MSSYFDTLSAEIGKSHEDLMPEPFLEKTIETEEEVIKEVNLVTGDREFPDDLRERLQTLISTRRIKYLGGEINEKAKDIALSMGYSTLLSDLHSAFHVVASKRIKTRFGILTDSPSANLVMREHHDHEALVGKDPVVDLTDGSVGEDREILADVDKFAKEATEIYMQDPEAGLKAIKEHIRDRFQTPPDVIGYRINNDQYCLACAENEPLKDGDDGPWAIKKSDPDWITGSAPVCCKCNREIVEEGGSTEEEGRIIFESVEEALAAAAKEGYGMIYTGADGKPWVKFSDWDLEMKGFKSPHFLLTGNRLYRIAACRHLGYDHSKEKGFDVQVHASEKDVEAGRINVDITVDPDSPLYDALSKEDRDPECDEDCARGGPENCNGCMD